MQFDLENVKKEQQHTMRSKAAALKILVLLMAIFTALRTSAQVVTVSVNVIPPYSPYYADYSGANASKVFIILQNTSANTLELKLVGKLQGDNGVLIQTYSNYTPLKPIVLGPHQVMQLNGTALRDIFNLNALSVRGIDKSKLALTSRLPEGNYNFCIGAIDYRRNLPLSAPGTGCTMLSITYPEPPVLMAPANNEQVRTTTPQTVVFSWTNPGSVPAGTQYTIQVAPMPDIAISPTQVLDATAIPILSQTVGYTSYVYSMANFPLQYGKKYAWRVTAKDPTGTYPFKNNGVSAASVFTYGSPQIDILPIVKDNTGNLNVVTPSCDPNTVPTVLIGSTVDLNIGWLWHEQLLSEQAFGMLDTMLLNHYTQTATAKGMVTISGYRLDFHRVTNIHNTDGSYANLSFQQNAPLQNFDLTKLQALAQKFIIGETYNFTVTALDAQGKQIDQVTSCDWQLKSVDDAAVPKLTINGRLAYGFSKGTDHPANNVSMTVQLSNTKTGSTVDYTKNYASVTTDESGNFSVPLTQAPADTGKKYLLVHINNPYYQQTDTNMLVQVPKINYSAVNGVIKVSQDTLKAGEIRTLVYSNNLTVHLRKGFPNSLSPAQDKAQFGDDNYQQDIFIDAATIDTMARLPDGIKINLYRKAKSDDIPYFEGSAEGPHSNKTKVLMPGKGFFIFVDAGTTQGGAAGKSQVVFKNLLCNFEVGDTYYLQAVLPDSLVTKDQLSAAETSYTFTPAKFYASPVYNNSTDYDVITPKPPTAHVKGRVMYRWPSTPGTLHPFANQIVNVNERFSISYNGDKSADACAIASATLTKLTRFANNIYLPEPWDRQGLVNGLQVGQVKTDANGYFDIEILVPVKMGHVDGVTVAALGDPCPKPPHIPPHINGESKGGDFIPGLGPVEEGGDPYEASGFGYQELGQDKGQLLLDNLNLLIGGLGAGDLNAGKLDLGPGVKGAAGGLGGGGAMIMHGPSAVDDGQVEVQPANNSFVDRYFDLEGIPNVVAIDSNANISPAHFVVQPFQTIDLGTVLTEVDEIKKCLVNIKPANGDYTLLSGALAVVYRAESAKHYDFFPDGEGTFKHVTKQLLRPDFKIDPNDPAVEWVIDTAINIPPDGQLQLGNRRLYHPNGASWTPPQYELELVPRSDFSGGGYFNPQYGNTSFPIYSDKMDIDVYPMSSRISGRVLNSITAKPVANASVNITAGGFTTIYTDNEGYFEIVNGQTKDWLGNYFKWKDNVPLSITVSLNGYTQVGFIPNGATVMAAGKNYFFPQLSLKPDKEIQVRSIDAVSKVDILGYALTPDTTLVTNNNFDYAYHVDLAGGSDVSLHIIPRDPAYFDETVSVSANGPNLVIPFYRRQHRMQFHIFNPYQAVSILQYKVLINNKEYAATYKQNAADGTISFSFENVSINNYTIQVINTGGQNIIPLQFNIANEESRTPVNYDVRVNPGATLSGYVRLDGHTVAGARVYLDYQTDSPPILDPNDVTNAGNAALSSIEAYTGNDGRYTMTGIPVTGSYLVKMHATLQGKGTVNGDFADVNVVPGTTMYHDFSLTTVSQQNVNNIYGFPLTVESVQLMSPGTFKVTGMVDLAAKNNSPFKSVTGNLRVRVKDVVLTSKDNSLWEAQGGVAKFDAVSSLKLKYLDQYNVLISNKKTFFGPVTPLELVHVDNGAGVTGMASIIDNSFNYPSTYLSFQDSVTNKPTQFYLYDPTVNKRGSEPLIMAIYNTQAQYKVYHLSNIKSDSLLFSFIGFKNTKADPSNSYIDPHDKQFHLDITLKGTVPHSDQGYVTVHVKNLLLDGVSIKAVTGSDPLVLNMQTWKLYVKDWTLDPTQGGIYSTDAYVSTGIVDIPIRTFNLRHDLFVLSDFEVSNITLGGGLISVAGMTEKNAHMVWDQACGSDHGAHWRFSAINADGSDVAQVALPAVNNKIAATTLSLNYFQLISYNNENIIGLSAQQNPVALFNNNKFKFLPASIASVPGSVSVTGTASFGLPRVGDQSLSLVYTKPGSAYDMIIGNFQPISFEGKGFVQFASDKGATFQTNGFITTLTGKVVEPSKFNPIDCTLSFGEKIGSQPTDAGNDEGTITLKKGFNLRLDGDGAPGSNDMALIISDADVNKMAVDKTRDWGNLTFSGAVSDPKSNNSGGDPLQTNPTVLTFNVLGDLDVSAKQISVSKISTPLGDLSLTYDFPSHELRGALHMDDIAMGSYKFTGDIQTVMGPKGLLMEGAGQLNTGTLFVDGFGVLNIGVLFADLTLTDDQIATVTEYSKAKNNTCWLDANKANFKGFFVTGGLDIIDKHEKTNFIIASGYFDANLGVEASIGANFNAKNYIALLGAHGEVDAGLSSITGTSISGGLAAHLTADATYTPAGFAINGDAGVTISFTVSQYIPLIGTKSFGGSKGAKVNFGVGGGQKSHLDFSLADDGNTVTCTNNGNVQ